MCLGLLGWFDQKSLGLTTDTIYSRISLLLIDANTNTTHKRTTVKSCNLRTPLRDPPEQHGACLFISHLVLVFAVILAWPLVVNSIHQLPEEVWLSEVGVCLGRVGQAEEQSCHELHRDGAHVGTHGDARQLVQAAGERSYSHVALWQLAQAA